jgi:two-component system phosphate regulon sensor histidine kinase PhoR
VRVRASSLLDSSGQRIGALTVFNDITRLRRLERVRQDFVANVSHELKTPITSIKGFVETLRDGAIDEPQRAGRFLEIIASQADRLGAIIEDLLNLSRLEQESESAELRLEVAPLAPVIEEAVTVCHLAAENKKIDIRVECPADLTARINGPLLEQAVSNLLDNAIKYSEPGQAVQVQARATADGADILVADRGSGIPAEHLPRLFERFYRVDKARSRQLGGTGLGLAIVKHISNALGGSVSVTSKPGSGSTFSIHLKR